MCYNTFVMNIKNCLVKGNKILNENKIEESILKSRILLSDILNVSKEYLIIHSEDDVPYELENKYFEGIEEIKNGKPIQYIINFQEFMGLKFYVDENVLIPQPDTEILVENVIKIAKNIGKDKIKILDLCTGSGVIAISLAKNLEFAEVFASDISKGAIRVAMKNSKSNNTKVEFIESDLFENIKGKFDIIVSNPPYIETDVIDKLQEEVKHEPKLALDGGQDGLKFYREILKKANMFLEKNGYLALEIGYNQKEKVMEMLKKYGFKDIACKKDLSNIDRVLIGKGA